MATDVDTDEEVELDEGAWLKAEVRDITKLRALAKRKNSFTAITQLTKELRTARRMLKEWLISQEEQKPKAVASTGDVIDKLTGALCRLPPHMLAEICGNLRAKGLGHVLDDKVTSLNSAREVTSG